MDVPLAIAGQKPVALADHALRIVAIDDVLAAPAELFDIVTAGD